MASPKSDLPTIPDPVEPPSGGGRAKQILIAAVIALIVILGIKVLFAWWWRRGGARKAITSLAEDGAVKLADALLDEVLRAPAA